MENRVEPGKHLEIWKIGMSEKEVLETFDEKPKKRSGQPLRYKDFTFYFNGERTLIAITAQGEYDGTYKGIGINSTLEDINKNIGAPYYSADNFNIFAKEEPRLYFDLTPAKMNLLSELEADDLDDLTHLKGLAFKDLKIKKIGIYSPKI